MLMQQIMRPLSSVVFNHSYTKGHILIVERFAGRTYIMLKFSFHFIVVENKRILCYIDL
jgi:hypothetical protein